MTVTAGKPKDMKYSLLGNMMMMMMMMESPVGTTYELRSHSLLPVGPRMTDKADSCGELSTAVITAKAS